MMQATAHFETDLLTQIEDAKLASMKAMMDASPDFSLIVTEPRNIAWLDALNHVAINFHHRDRRRLKREYRKAMKKALAGELPKVMVTLDPPDLGSASKSRILMYPDSKLGEPVRAYADGFKATTVLKKMLERKDA